MAEICSPHNLEFVIADLVKKLEDQKAEAERQLKVLSRQIKVRELEMQSYKASHGFKTPHGEGTEWL